MKHENAQKISSKISPNFSPNSSPRISRGPKSKIVAAIPLWGMSGVTVGSSIAVEDAVENRGLYRVLVSHLFFHEV